MKLRLILALVVAALFSDIFSIQPYRRLWRAFKALLGIMPNDDMADDDLYIGRLTVCNSCPVFFKPLMTCGSPLKKELRGLGCYCNMEAAARQKSKTCFLDDEMGSDAPHGWIKSGL